MSEFCYLEKGINTAVAKAQTLFMRSGKKQPHESFIQNYVAIIVLFCASGTGIFGAMREGMTGDPSILIAKSFLDFFTASGFRGGFEDKGRFRSYVQDIPVYLIVHDNPGLLGSGAHLRQVLGQIL